MFCNQKKLGFYEKEVGAKESTFFWNDNICPDMLTDDRQKKWKKMRRKYGFDSRELWALHDTIACFIYPRLKYFRDAGPGHPIDLTDDEWMEILDKMIWSFEQHVIGEFYNGKIEPEYWAKYKEGIDLFSEWFTNLWC